MTERNITGLLLIDIRVDFDDLSRIVQLPKIDAMRADKALVMCTCSFMTERNISLVVDGPQCDPEEVKTVIMLRSLIVSILFALYQCGIFKDEEEEMEECMATSFVGDYL